MNTYFLKYRGTKTVRTVQAGSLKLAKIKYLYATGVVNIENAMGYVQQVFKCNYQDMQGEIIK